MYVDEPYIGIDGPDDDQNNPQTWKLGPGLGEELHTGEFHTWLAQRSPVRSRRALSNGVKITFIKCMCKVDSTSVEDVGSDMRKAG